MMKFSAIPLVHALTVLSDEFPQASVYQRLIETTLISFRVRQQALNLIRILHIVDKNNMCVGAPEIVSKPGMIFGVGIGIAIGFYVCPSK
jgi:hypothetical protein